MAARLMAFWGTYNSFSVLGSLPAGSWTITYVRLNFERAETLLEYLWNEGKLLGVQFSSYRGYFSFRPTGERSFASYNLRSGESVVLSFASDSLTVTSRGQTLVAHRRRS